MDESLRRQAIALYDRFTHEGMERRRFMGRMAALAGSAAAAEALVMAIAANPAAAALTAANDRRLVVRRGGLGIRGRPLNGYIAAARGKKKMPAVVIIHENRGLNAHIEDVTRRIALAGYFAVAPDMLSPLGGTPTDEEAARAAIAKLDLAAGVNDVVLLLDRLRQLRHVNGKVGAVGFCWGGAFVNHLAVAAGAKLNAAVSYYGPAPDPAQAVKVQAPILLHYAELDERVNATGRPWYGALKKAGKNVTAYTYPGVDHAFSNDTSAERYNKKTAELAWRQTLAFLAKNLA